MQGQAMKKYLLRSDQWSIYPHILFHTVASWLPWRAKKEGIKARRPSPDVSPQYQYSEVG